MIARMLNILIATWVLVAAFAWPVPTGLFIAMMVLALGIIGGSVLHMYRGGQLGRVTLSLGALLLVSGFLFQARSDFILWNNFLCGVAVGVLSLVKSRENRGRWVPSGTRRRVDVY